MLAENYAYQQPFLLAQTDGRGEAKKKAETSRILRAQESRPVLTQKGTLAKGTHPQRTLAFTDCLTDFF